MTILAVDNSAQTLASIRDLLSAAFPNDLVLTLLDPLAAAKYSYTNSVDVLLVAPETRPMNGRKLSGFVRQTNPGAIILMTVEGGKDALDCLRPDNVDALLSRPISAAAVLCAVENACQGRWADNRSECGEPARSAINP